MKFLLRIATLLVSFSPVVALAQSIPFPITPVVSTAAEGGHVLKSSAGSLYGVYVTSGATAGYLMVFNATSVPGDGAVTPVECVPVPANSVVSLNYGPGPAAAFSTGITAVFSTTGCFTKTVSNTAFFQGFVK